MGFFNRPKSKEPPQQQSVFVFTFKIKSGRTEIPAPMVGAYVVAYTMADTPEAAAERAGRELQAMGYMIDDLDTKGGQIALGDWDKHVGERWPEFADRFPPEHELAAVIERENALFSPFAGFE